MKQKEVYEIIIDKDELKYFIDNVLPPLKNDEIYYLMLFARNKYMSQEQKDLIKLKAKQSLKSFTSRKEYIVRKLNQLEISSYTSDNNLHIPENALACYITPTPRSLIKATKNSIKEMLDILFKENDFIQNPKSIVMKNIQKSLNKTYYMDFDFDIPESETQPTINKIEEVLNTEATTYIKTKSGFHLLVKIDAIKQELKKKWYLCISNLDNVDVRGDNLLPIPGCRQGDFVPYVIKDKNDYTRR